MSEKKFDDIDAALRIFWEIAEATVKATDDEVSAILRSEGRDPAAVAEETRSFVGDALKTFRKRKLREAQAAYAKASQGLLSKTYALPATAELRLSLLMTTLTQEPKFRNILTTQHRDFKGLTDEDVVGYLEDLASLGVLPDRSSEGE